MHRPVFNRHRPKPPLPEWPRGSMSRVEPRRVTQVQPLHACTEIRIRRLHNGMIMCTHQGERVNPEAIALMHFPRQLQEVRAVAVIQEYLAPLCAAVEHMIPHREAEFSALPPYPDIYTGKAHPVNES